MIKRIVVIASILCVLMGASGCDRSTQLTMQCFKDAWKYADIKPRTQEVSFY